MAKRQGRIDTVIRIPGRYAEPDIRRSKHQNTLAGWSMREHQTYPALVTARSAVWRVVKLEHKTAAGLDQLRLPGRKRFGKSAGPIPSEEFSGYAIAGSTGFQSKRNAHRLGREPFRAGLTHAHHNVMRVPAIAGADFGELYPGVFSKSRGHDDIEIGRATCRER